jgi:hypothetical protein
VSVGRESFGGADSGFGGFFCAVFGWGGGLKRGEEGGGGGGDIGYGLTEGGLVRFGGFVEAGDLADELEGCGVDFVGGDGWGEVVKGLDVAAHGVGSGRESRHNGESGMGRATAKATADSCGMTTKGDGNGNGENKADHEGHYGKTQRSRRKAQAEADPGG